MLSRTVWRYNQTTSLLLGSCKTVYNSYKEWESWVNLTSIASYDTSRFFPYNQFQRNWYLIGAIPNHLYSLY